MGAGGRTFAYHGMHEALKARAAAAVSRSSVSTASPHRGDALASGGRFRARVDGCRRWATRAMLDRYTGASASERAATEARTLNLGDM